MYNILMYECLWSLSGNRQVFVFGFKRVDDSQSESFEKVIMSGTSDSQSEFDEVVSIRPHIPTSRD